MKKSRFTESQIIAVLKQAEAGTPGCPSWPRTRQQLGDVLQVTQQVRRHGGVYGGPDDELEEESLRLKKMYAEAKLSVDLLKEALSKMVVISAPEDGPNRG